MSFLIEYYTGDVPEKRPKNSVDLNPRCTLVTLESLNGQKTIKADTLDGSVIYYGDLISAPFKGNSEEFISWLNSAKGNFQGIYHSQSTVLIFSSMFSVLPLFYTEDVNRLVISDQIKNLIPYMEDNVVDDFHLLERILFNYSLTDRTCVSGIKQVPANSFLKLEKSGYELHKHTKISNLFTDSPKPLRKSINDLVDLFNVQLEEYLPNHLFNVAFTSGFDGRSIVSSCIKNRKKFTAYSFGTIESDDVKIPSNISKKIGIDYQPIIIDDHYLQHVYLESAKLMVTDSNGLATIGRAHYVYGSEILSKRSNVMVSGNFGSELLRSSHLEGVLTTGVFFYWVRSGLPSTLSEFITLFPEYGFLSKERFAGIYENLIIELEVKRKKICDLPLNAKLYCLIWEESLRNYFGGELSMQKKYLIHRSPFLDFTFFKEIQKTMVSGAYFNYRDKNPVRRMRGQLFYANLIRRNNKDLFLLPTGKGYSPSDILSVNGKFKLIYSKFVKRSNPSENNIDPLFSTKGFDMFREEFKDNMSSKLDGCFEKGGIVDENSMKTLISFSVFFKHLDSVRILEGRNLQ